VPGKVFANLMTRKQWLLGLGALVLAALFTIRLWKPFPKDTTPEGAYLRIAKHLTQADERGMFPYLETEAQWASYTLFNARTEARALVQADFPESERGSVPKDVVESVPTGEDAFVALARKKGWLTRLRKDLSAVQSVEIVGERAAVVTQRGTRYPFRKRENGIWGITIFTAELVNESVRAVRDLEQIKKSAEDYRRARSTK
jgi:hypothetical protein